MCPVRRIIEKGLTTIFKMKMINNTYRHCIATDLMKKGVPRNLVEDFLRTSSGMLKKVYEQFYGSNKRILMHTVIMKHVRMCDLSVNAIAGPSTNVACIE